MKNKKTKKYIVLTTCFILLFALITWIMWGNTALELNTYKIESCDLPDNFKGYKIAHVSDLHNAEMGASNEKLLKMLVDAEPDIIAITGDIIDSRRTDIDIALSFAREAMKIAPCYYVTGNHEARISDYDKLIRGLCELGVTVLDNAFIEIWRGEEKIILMGVADPSFKADYLFGDESEIVQSALQNLTKNNDSFTVLLSHRPELFDVYSENNIDLALTGHAHGGQFRLPFAGGVIAPDQGFFPKYDSGVYKNKGATMVVSRGIGNSIIPFRINNRPEVILIELA